MPHGLFYDRNINSLPFGLGHAKKAGEEEDDLIGDLINDLMNKLRRCLSRRTWLSPGLLIIDKEHGSDVHCPMDI